MAYQLRDGVTFCTVAARCIFLDVPADRYFALARDAEVVFFKLVGREPLSGADHDVLRRLGEAGPLEFLDGEQPVLASPDAPAITGSLLDHLPERGGGWETVRALYHLKLAARSLRRRGLAATLHKLATRKRAASGDVPLRRVEAVTIGFSAASALSTTLDQCLPRSLAVANGLLAIGGTPDLIIGVKLQPFQAHCWVQIDGQLVNERRDVANAFTPILVL